MHLDIQMKSIGRSISPLNLARRKIWFYIALQITDRYIIQSQKQSFNQINLYKRLTVFNVTVWLKLKLVSNHFVQLFLVSRICSCKLKKQEIVSRFTVSVKYRIVASDNLIIDPRGKSD